ncbi:MAG: 16S rRNA (uracil(1498)-N(3))-methyltransferase [Firmicutes bacterium]|nr:16S rRNA (uracil(1498)-N(3))-methyltransferase [Bacillota bacterium]
MSRFFVEPQQICGERIYMTDGEDIKHLSRVLRLTEGDFVDVSDTKEYEYRCEIEEIARDQVILRIHDKQSFAKEPKLQVTLYQGIPKQGKMETIIQKTVELGVYRIVPVFTKRTVVTDSRGNFGKKVQRWQKISAEAVKQCKRGIIPEVAEAITFEEMVREAAAEHDLVLFLFEDEQETTIKQVLRQRQAAAIASGVPLRSVALLIGPEGGFSAEEAETIVASGACCATLGKTILRTETAGMAALAMTMYELEL